MLRIISLVVGLGLLIGSASIGDARTTYWAANGTSCTPDRGGIQNDLYAAQSGAIRHLGGAYGLFLLYCPVYPNNGGDITPNRGWLTYSINEAGATIDARFFKLSRTTGSRTQLFAIPGTVPTGGVNETYQIPVSFTLDFDNNYYYYQVDIDRASTETSSVAMFYGVSIGDN